jgi:hypothetical protein
MIKLFATDKKVKRGYVDFKLLLKELSDNNNLTEGELVEPLIKNDKEALQNLGLSDTG